MADTDNYIEELDAISEQMRELTGVAESPEFKKPVDALDAVIGCVHDSWSGSNLGYHARAYYQDYKPPPIDDMFDKERGVSKERFHWVVHPTDDGVKADLMSRAGVGDLRPLKEKSDAARMAIVGAKEAIQSILSNYLSVQSDSHLAELKERVENTSAPSAIAFARGYVPRGTQMSRDTLAINQGLAVAPHQQLLGEIKAIGAPYLCLEISR